VPKKNKKQTPRVAEERVTLGALETTTQVCERMQISKATLWRLVKDGYFPRPLRMGGKGFPRSLSAEVNDFLRRARAERGPQPGVVHPDERNRAVANRGSADAPG